MLNAGLAALVADEVAIIALGAGSGIGE